MTLEYNKIIESMAVSMQKEFPVINTGLDSDGKWGTNPLDIGLFKRSATIALQALLEQLPDVDKELEEQRDDYLPFLMMTKQSQCYEQLMDMKETKDDTRLVR